MTLRLLRPTGYPSSPERSLSLIPPQPVPHPPQSTLGPRQSKRRKLPRPRLLGTGPPHDVHIVPPLMIVLSDRRDAAGVAQQDRVEYEPRRTSVAVQEGVNVDEFTGRLGGVVEWVQFLGDFGLDEVFVEVLDELRQGPWDKVGADEVCVVGADVLCPVLAGVLTA